MRVMLKPKPGVYCDGPLRNGLTCEKERLRPLRKVEEYESDTAERKEWIYQCEVCGGLYKYLYVCHYYSAYLFDTEEGWSELCNRYFKVGDYWGHKVELTPEEASEYGYPKPETLNGPGARCGLPRTPSGLTCPPGGLAFVAWCNGQEFGLYEDSIHRCKKCGQFYKQIWEERRRFRFHKPNERVGDTVPFPFEEAVRHGYAYTVQVTTEAECEAAIARFDALTRERRGIDPELRDLAVAVSAYGADRILSIPLRAKVSGVELTLASWEWQTRHGLNEKAS